MMIIQSSTDDRTTYDVISWIYHLKKDQDNTVKLLNDEILIKQINIELSNSLINIVTDNFFSNDLTKYWYRRGYIKIENNRNLFSVDFDRIFEKQIINPVVNYINSNLYKNSINKFNDNYISKLTVLTTAQKLKINIPDSLITNNFQVLKSFVAKNKTVITKPIENSFVDIYYKNKKINFNAGTEIIEIDWLNTIPEFNFMPSFFQKYIEKKYEIRSFFLNGKFYSMAIFSQLNNKTKIDYRNYDLEHHIIYQIH
jgi:hypothetical protein